MIAHVFSIITTLTLSGVDLVITYKNPPQPPELCLYFTLAPSDHSFAFSTRVFITCLPSEKLNEMLSIVDELAEMLLYHSLIILRVRNAHLPPIILAIVHTVSIFIY